jgi:hypothetical protein
MSELDEQASAQHVRILQTSMCMDSQNSMNKRVYGLSELYEQACAWLVKII